MMNPHQLCRYCAEGSGDSSEAPVSAKPLNAQQQDPIELSLEADDSFEATSFFSSAGGVEVSEGVNSIAQL